MEIVRIADNSDFIKKVILSIDPDIENYRLNYSNFRQNFQSVLESTGDPSKALEVASKKLKQTIEKRKEPTLKTLQKETSLLNAENKQRRREEIMSLIKSKSGIEDEEILQELYRKFVMSKRHNKLSDDSTVDRVVFQYKDKLPKDTPEEPIPHTEEDYQKALRIIKYLDPKGFRQNQELLRRYLRDGKDLNTSFQHIQDLVKYREFLKSNGMPINSLTMRIFDTYGQDLEKAMEMVQKRLSEGSMPLESKVMDHKKGIESKSNDEMVVYNGEPIALHRLIQKLYAGKPLSQIQKSYSTIKNLVYGHGLSIDDAVARNFREEKIFKNKQIFRMQFPEDPEQAELIFESYYVDEGLTFEESMMRTKQDLGKRLSTAQKKYKLRIK